MGYLGPSRASRGYTEIETSWLVGTVEARYMGSTVRSNNSSLTQHSRGRSSVTGVKLPGPEETLDIPAECKLRVRDRLRTR